MKKTNKTFIALSVLFSFCLPSFALSWSGVIDNTTKISENHDFTVPVLEQSNGIYLSLRAPISKKGSLVFDAEALYKYNLKYAFKTNTSTFKNIVDSDLFRLSGSWKLGNGMLNMNAGRFYVNDSNGIVFNQISDGLLLAYNAKKFDAKLYGGYTGLLNSFNVSMVENTIVPEKNKDFYSLCPQYIPVMADFSYKTLFNKHTVGILGEAFIPVSTVYKQKMYGSVYLKGPVSTWGSYSVVFTAGTVEFKKFMFDGKADFNVYVPKGMITAGAEYLSSANENILTFTGITSRTITNDSRFNGGIIPKLSYMFVKRNLYASVTGKGVIGITKADTKFHGIDVSGSVIFNILSDLQISCIIDTFTGFDDYKKAGNYAATLKAALQF